MIFPARSEGQAVRLPLSAVLALEPDPRVRLHLLRDTQDDLDLATFEAVVLARRRAMSWEEIGSALGVTRQAVWQRFRDACATGRPPPARRAARVAGPRGPVVKSDEVGVSELLTTGEGPC